MIPSIVEDAAQRVVVALCRIQQTGVSTFDDARSLWLAIALLEEHIGRAASRAQARATEARALTAVLGDDASASGWRDHQGPIGDGTASLRWPLDDLLTDEDALLIEHTSGMLEVSDNVLCTGTPVAPVGARLPAPPGRKRLQRNGLR